LALIGMTMASLPALAESSAPDRSAAIPSQSAAAPPSSAALLSPLTIDDKYLHNDIPAQNQPGTLTLHGAVEEAVVHNRDVREANLQVSRFKWDHLASEAARLPNVRVISYLADNTINSELIPARANAFFFASAMFPVTQQYRFGLEARAANLAREIASQRLRLKLDETTAHVKEAYYKLALDESLLGDIADSIQYLTELKRLVADQVNRGNSLKYEEMEVAARLAKARFEETKARNTRNIDREKFNHLLGRDLKTNVSLELIMPADQVEMDVQQAERLALSSRAEVREADAKVRLIRTEKKVLLSEYIPNVSVGVVYITTPGFNNSIVPKNILAPGIFITWNAFDWGRKAMLAKGKTKAEQAAAVTAQNAREEILIDLHAQMNKVTESRQLVDTTQLSRAASREGLRVSMNRYKFTEAKLADVLASQNSLADANNSYHQALLAFWDAKAEFDRAVGLEQQ
jgi:outer membrane protein TolC